MKIFFFSFLTVWFIQGYGQIKEGHVVYERVMQLPVRMFNADPAIADQLPKSRTDQFELSFSGNKSLWEFLPDAKAEGDGNSISVGNTFIRFQGGGSESSFYELDQNKVVNHREVMNRGFVVTDTIRKYSWKLTDETKMILGHSARKAISTQVSTRYRMTMENGETKRTAFSDTAAVAAWFAADIPVASGPADFQGLPGLILLVDVNKGQTVYTAVEFSQKVNASKIREPKDGKRVTAAEFVVERDKLMEEMRKNMPAGNSFRVQN